MIVSGQIALDRIRIKLNGDLLSDQLRHSVAELYPELVNLDVPFSCRRRGAELKIVAGDPVPMPDETLIQAMRNAHKWANDLRRGVPLKTIASTKGFSDSYVARIIPLAGLSPRIQAAIIDGDQPINLTLEALVRAKLPLDWSIQERLFGFT